MNHQFFRTPAHAAQLDKDDPLAGYRDHFYIPEGSIYMDGNSLGLLSKEAEFSLRRVVNEWRDLGIKGWLKGKQPWFYFAEKVAEMAAGIVGAEPDELIMTGTTTVNIHALISTFYWPKGGRTRILADSLNFPSDIYALRGQIRMKNLDPDKELILVDSRDGYTLSEGDIVDCMDEQVAVALLPSVLYRSGQLLDMEYLTREAHKRGIIIGFDCSHSAGVVPHQLSKWGVDFAVFCSYKYLNGGPGSSAFLYLNREHFDRQPVLSGWFGNKKETQFNLSLDFDHARSAGGWQISSPGILGSSPVEGSLQLINQATIESIRSKSMAMTDYLVALVDEYLSGEPYHLQIVSPRDASERSGHIALTREREAFRINQALKSKGVVPDFRPPGLIRIAPSPLYNTYQEIWQVVQYLREIIDNREYENFSQARDEVS